MSAAEDRAAYVSALRAIADLIESDAGLPIPHGYLNVFPHGTDAVAAFLRVPLPWKAEAPGPGDNFYDFCGEIGSYTTDGFRLNVFAIPGDVATEEASRPVPVMVPAWKPRPEIAALLSEPMRDES